MLRTFVTAGDVQMALAILEAYERGEEPPPEDVCLVIKLFLSLTIAVIEGRAVAAEGMGGTVH